MSTPFERVAALKLLSRALMRTSSAPSDAGRLEAELRSQSSASWDRMLDLAAELGVVSALWGAVHDLGSSLPGSVAETLHQAQLSNAVRNARLRRALTEAVVAFNDAGVVPLLFKGALALVDGTPGALGGRWMVDLDVLVPTDELDAARGALEQLDYVAEPGRPFLHPHELPLVHEGWPGPIELHTELGSPPIPDVLPAAEAWDASDEIRVGAGHARALSPTHQVMHNVLHASVQDLNHAVAGLPFRQLLALNGLIRHHGERIDWTAMTSRMGNAGLGRELRDHLWLAHRFTGTPLPRGSWGLGPRIHALRVIGSFAFGWPADVQRNLRYAFGRAYLDSLYGHRDRRLHVIAARIRHAAFLLRRDGTRAIDDLRLRRG